MLRTGAENISIPGGEDPYLWISEAGHFHLLYHRMNDGQQTGGDGFSECGRRWTWGPPAYDASVRYADPAIGRRWFASRERPHLVWGRRRSDGAPEPVALVSGVKVCDFENSSVADCNGNTWPGYRDASYTSVQPIRSSHSPGGILKTEDGDAARTCHAALGELCWAKAYGRQSGCTICAGRAQAALRRAGCSNEAITGWCAEPSVRL